MCRYDTLTDLTKKHNEELSKPFEECRGIGSSFGYNRHENLEDYATSEQLIHVLIEKVSKGGNLLLNIGPTGDGRIPVIMQQRLSDIGKWLQVNGEGIYGTRRWIQGHDIINKANNPRLYFTRNMNGDLFVICTVYPETDVVIDNLKKRAKSIHLLGSSKVVDFVVSDLKSSLFSVSIKPPYITPSSSPCLYAWTFKIEDVV
jgi:alpha-L-fucosidase